MTKIVILVLYLVPNNSNWMQITFNFVVEADELSYGHFSNSPFNLFHLSEWKRHNFYSKARLHPKWIWCEMRYFGGSNKCLFLFLGVDWKISQALQLLLILILYFNSTYFIKKLHCVWLLYLIQLICFTNKPLFSLTVIQLVNFQQLKSKHVNRFLQSMLELKKQKHKL